MNHNTGVDQHQNYIVERGHKVPMRDGTLLTTHVYLPDVDGSYPVVLERGYVPGMEENAYAFLDAGYAYVGQKARGDLNGNMFFPDAQDGYDCLEWVSQQTWCNGDIAMYGRSFHGGTQWLVAPEQHPNLKAIIPQNFNPDPWEKAYRDHGALALAHTARRIYRTVATDNTHQATEFDNTDLIREFGGWDGFYRHLPLIDLDEAMTGSKNNLWREYVGHDTYDDYWKAISVRDKFDKITIPVFIMGGWYDYYTGAAFNAYRNLREIGATPEIRIVINPANHYNHIVGDRDFGDSPDKDELLLATRWLDRVIKGEENGVEDEPRVSIFVMGENKWRGEDEWPLARTVFTNYYFRSDGSRVGELSTQEPAGEPPTIYNYDPDDPVPTLGGNHSSPEDNPEVIRVGPVDQRSIAERDDVLVFTTSPLAEDTEVTGPVAVTLWAATSGKDTDFIARLIDLYPDGTAFNLTEGIIRARFRESIWEEPKLLTPGEIYEYSLELLPTSNVFRKGHRISVHLTSSSFPMFDRNPNTGNEQCRDTEQQVAAQTIYHDAQYPSHIVLPVIPAG